MSKEVEHRAETPSREECVGGWRVSLGKGVISHPPLLQTVGRSLKGIIRKCFITWTQRVYGSGEGGPSSNRSSVLMKGDVDTERRRGGHREDTGGSLVKKASARGRAAQVHGAAD